MRWASDLPRHTTDSIREAFRRTKLEFGDPPALRLDLTSRLPPDLERCMADLGLVLPCAIVTAENPLGRVLDEADNAMRRAALDACVRDQGHQCFPADGVALDGSHRERGLAVCLTLDEAIRLARRFEQLAIFWLDEAGVSLVWIQGGVDSWLLAPASRDS